MNRTQAIERVDEILGLFAEMYASGRCPRCETLLFDERDRHRPPQTVAARRVVHEGSCEVAAFTEELARLSRRHAIPLEPVLLTASESDTLIVGVRRGVEPSASDPPAASDVDGADTR